MNKIELESVKKLISAVIKENSMTEEEIEECGAACGGLATTTSDLGASVQYLGDKGTKKEEEILSEEDEIMEMARGILAPQEVAKREYATEFPNSGIKTSDQFLRKVINNPNAEGHDKYVKRLAYLLKNSGSYSFSNIAAQVDLDNSEEADDYALAKAYADGILNHRRNMSYSRYHSGNTVNAYQNNIIKRGPYYKSSNAAPIPEKDLGNQVSDEYNNVDPVESNKVLMRFFKSLEWEQLTDREKIRTLNTIENEADLDQQGVELINRVKDFIVSDY